MPQISQHGGGIGGGAKKGLSDGAARDGTRITGAKLISCDLTDRLPWLAP
jgi:hypothetical protein